MIYKLSLIGHKGLNKDIASTETNMFVFNDCKNVRFIDGSIHLRGGTQVFFSSNEEIYDLEFHYSTSSNYLYCTPSKIYRYTPSSHSDVSISSYTFTQNEISSIVYSGFVIFNHRNHIPQVWAPTFTSCSNLPNFPSTLRCKSLRNWNNILIAMNLTKSGTNYPHTIRWSHPADPGNLPPSWAIDDPNYDSGEMDIAEGYDEIIDGMQLKNSFMIYKGSSAWRLDYVGAPYIFTLSNVSKNSGIIAMNCIGEIDNNHVVFGSDDIYINNGREIQSIIDKRIRRWLYNSINESAFHLCCVVHNQSFKEMWFCYPTVSSSACNMAVVWNYNENNITIRDIPNITCHTVVKLLPETVSWDVDADIWDIDLTAWDKTMYVNPYKILICGSIDNNVYLFDNYPADINVPIEATVEKSNIYFEDENGMKLLEHIKTVKAIRPRITGDPNKRIDISIGIQDYIDAPITWVKTMPYYIGQTFQCDCLVSGRIFAIKLENVNAYYWTCSAIDIEVEVTGKW